MRCITVIGLGAMGRPITLNILAAGHEVTGWNRSPQQVADLVAGGLLLGGSTGTVVHGAMTWLADHHAQDVTAVAISPDRGHPYLDTIYQPGWVLDHFGAEMLASAGSTAGPGLQSGPVPGPQLPAAAQLTDSVATASLRRLAQ